MAKPRSDSWKYLLRFLPKSYKPVKELAKWLEVHKPLFWLKDAQRLAEYVKNRKIKKISREDIPATVPLELVENLVRLLQQVNNYYVYLRRKREEYEDRLNQEYESIPSDEREQIERIKKTGPRYLWPLQDVPEERLFFDRREELDFTRIDKIKIWLSRPRDERLEWLTETERLAILVNKLQALESIKRMEELEREAKQQAYKYKHSAEESANKWYEDFMRKYGHLLNGTHIGKQSAYSILGISPGASQQEIKVAFRRKAKEFHPDVGGSAQEFQQIHEAYQLLKTI